MQFKKKILATVRPFLSGRIMVETGNDLGVWLDYMQFICITTDPTQFRGV